jgi:hypothetical protein
MPSGVWLQLRADSAFWWFRGRDRRIQPPGKRFKFGGWPFPLQLVHIFNQL